MKSGSPGSHQVYVSPKANRVGWLIGGVVVAIVLAVFIPGKSEPSLEPEVETLTPVQEIILPETSAPISVEEPLPSVISDQPATAQLESSEKTSSSPSARPQRIKRVKRSISS